MRGTSFAEVAEAMKRLPLLFGAVMLSINRMVGEYAAERESIKARALHAGVTEEQWESVVAEVIERAHTHPTWGSLAQQNDEIQHRCLAIVFPEST